jgi:hypothetical protein
MIARGDIIAGESPGRFDGIVPIYCGVKLSEVLMQMREEERY